MFKALACINGFAQLSTDMNCIFIMVLITFCVKTCAGEISGSEHRTKAASEKLADLWCYRCDNMVDGDHCLDLHDNATSLHLKCSNEERICKVKRISMSSSIEDHLVGKPKLWLLQRNCSKSCEPGCIVIGERTKLHSCITCCEDSFCNAGNYSASGLRNEYRLLIINIVINIVCYLS